MGHGIRLFRQVQQGLRDAARNVQEGEVTHFLRGYLQAVCHLGRQAHQDVRVYLNQLAEFLVGNFSHFTGGLRPNPGATLLTFFKQSKLADEIPLVKVGQDHLFTFFILNQHRDGAFDDVVKRFGFFTLVNQRTFGWIFVDMAMRQEPFESRVCLRFAENHSLLSSVVIAALCHRGQSSL